MNCENIYLARAITGHKNADAVAVHAGQIVWIGSRSELGLVSAPRVELAGVIAPGFVDAHVHAFDLGAQLSQVDLSQCHSEVEIAEVVFKAAQKLPENTWILGYGWNEALFPNHTLPDRASLDALVPNHFVALTRLDGHALLANSAALNCAKVFEITSHSLNGQIALRADRSPSGLLIDEAMNLIWNVVEKPTIDELARRFLLGQNKLASLGVTSFHEICCDESMCEALLQVAESGLLRQRVGVYIDGRFCRVSEVLHQLSVWKTRFQRLGSDVCVLGVKLFADGALGSRGAAMKEVYADANHCGLLAKNETFARIVEFWRAHCPVALHAIGDAAFSKALDIAEQNRELIQEHSLFRIEHAQFVACEDLLRARSLPISIVMQPMAFYDDALFATQRVGESRLKSEGYRCRSLRDLGHPFAFASDAPYGTASPIEGLKAACSSNRGEEAISLSQAFQAYTASVAAISGGEPCRLNVGQRADFIELNFDPLAAEANAQALSLCSTVIHGMRFSRES